MHMHAVPWVSAARAFERANKAAAPWLPGGTNTRAFDDRRERRGQIWMIDGRRSGDTGRIGGDCR